MRPVKAMIGLAAVIGSLLLSGCMETEPNDLAYVVALGFDKAEAPGNYVMTIQFARPTSISGSGGESGGSGKGIVENIAVEAPNIYAGINLADHIVSKKLSLFHAKLIVFSEDVAKEGISDIMETFARNEELRPDIFLAVAPESAQEYLFKVKPVVEVNPARYYQLIYEQDYTAGIPKNTAAGFYGNEKSGLRDNALPLAGTVKLEKEDEGGGESGGGGGEEANNEGTDPKESENKLQPDAPSTDQRFEYRLRDYIAGEVGINENNESEAMGMAYFLGEKEVGRVGSIETVLYNMLTGSFHESYLTLMCDKQDPVTTLALANKKPKYDIDRENRKVEITMYFESDLYSLPTDYLAESGIEGFENAAREEITEAAEKFINETIRPSGADLLGLRSKFKAHFLTNADFERHKDEVMDYDISVKVKFRVRRTGLTIKEAGE